jgi:hypothetical protein
MTLDFVPTFCPSSVGALAALVHALMTLGGFLEFVFFDSRARRLANKKPGDTRDEKNYGEHVQDDGFHSGMFRNQR